MHGGGAAEHAVAKLCPKCIKSKRNTTLHLKGKHARTVVTRGSAVR